MHASLRMQKREIYSAPVVHHPGTKANPFMERIVASAQPDITTLFETALDKVTGAIAAQSNA